MLILQSKVLKLKDPQSIPGSYRRLEKFVQLPRILITRSSCLITLIGIKYLYPIKGNSNPKKIGSFEIFTPVRLFSTFVQLSIIDRQSRITMATLALFLLTDRANSAALLKNSQCHITRPDLNQSTRVKPRG